jgi:predicted enzyme related to lactoylglutathione lyase
VADIASAYARLLTLGATALEPVNEVGGGIKVAAVQDPFGNRLGIIENPHFDASAVR